MSSLLSKIKNAYIHNELSWFLFSNLVGEEEPRIQGVNVDSVVKSHKLSNVSFP